MNEKKARWYLKAALIAVIVIFPFSAKADDNGGEKGKDFFPDNALIESHVKEIMTEGKIPGAAVVLIKGNEHVFTKGYGYADTLRKIPVTPDTLFELASCSKSFTALGILRLVNEGKVNLTDPVSKFFPGFYTTFKGKKYPITVNHLLNHISGIPGRTFGKIPLGNNRNALQDVVKMVSGIKLNYIPGMGFEYCNTNFDILGAIIEKVSGMSYEEYMKRQVFIPLGMNRTFVGVSTGQALGDKPMSAAHKISFGKPLSFESPVFRGNFPAANVVSSANDMVVWVKSQLNLVSNDLSPVITRSHGAAAAALEGIGDTPALYMNGWFIRSAGGVEFFHSGLNPGFTSYITFKPRGNIAVAVLSNSNSSGAIALAERLKKLLEGKTGKKELNEYSYQGGLDTIFTVVTYVMGGLIFFIIGLISWICFEALRGIRCFESFSLEKLYKIGVALSLTIPLLIGIYFFPDSAASLTWEKAFAWAPGSFPTALGFVFAFIGAVNVLFIFSLIFPYKDQTSFKNKYVKPLPMILFLSFLSGLASAATMFLISTSFFSPLELKYLIYFFGLALFISTAGQKIVQTRMNEITTDIVYGLRMKLITKIFATRFQMFEKIDSGRIYSTVNNDTDTISTSAGLVVGTISNFVTAISAFVYLSAISFWATLFTLLFGVLLGVFYIIVGKKARVLMEKMRDTQNVFMKLIEGLVRGFRELSMHKNKKVEYESDVEKSCREYRDTRISSTVMFINANLLSSSMISILLAGICISFPRLFPEMSIPRLISFIMILLYMIGPVTSIMSSFPIFIRVKVSWDRIQKFIAEIPALEGVTNYKEIPALSHKGQTVESIEAKDLFFSYPGESGKSGFGVGPIDIKVNKGEVLFMVGGNGSGKTTLAKLIAGLYLPESGYVKIDGKEISGDDYLGEYFSVVFGDFHLFEKLYNVDIDDKKKEEIAKYLELLDLQGKVDIQKGSFSTINLSGGQRKRLALLQCYLEDCPIYLFDEVAADQDPEFRKFFYRNLLPQMKERGKIVIAITHDDHYFDVADKIIKLDMGKIDDKFFPMGLTVETLQRIHPAKSV